MHMHTQYKHTHTNTLTHRSSYTHKCTHTHSYTHTQAHAYIVQTNTYTFTHSLTGPHTYTNGHTLITGPHTHKFTHTYAFSHTRTCIASVHTHTTEVAILTLHQRQDAPLPLRKWPVVSTHSLNTALLKIKSQIITLTGEDLLSSQLQLIEEN